MQKKYRRKKKLIEPKLQIKFVLGFACTAGVAVIVQALVLVHALTGLSQMVPHDRLVVLDSIPGILSRSLVITFLLLIPLATSVGILMSFRVAGPLYRFRVFLREIIAGAKPGDCRIRQGDELWDFCHLLNEATAPLRVRDEEELDEEEHEPAAEGEAA